MFEGAGQSCHESVRFGAKAYGNSDIVGYPRLVEMANQHPLLTKCRSQLGAVMGGVACENEIAFDGSTSKPSHESSWVILSRSFIIIERLRWKCSSSSKAAIAPAWAGRPSG